MKLPPELVSRLQAIKALLDLGDLELASVAAARLQAHRDIGSVTHITECFGAHRYVEAGAIITTLLTEGTRLVRWTDPEIKLLEAELERLSSELAEAESEQAEMAHLIARFHAAHHQALGKRLEKLLRLRMLFRKREAEADSAKASDFAKAKEDYDNFQQESATREEEDERTNWKLSEEEEQELKRLFRKASKKCHPDVVSSEHQTAAAAMFRDLSEAYEKGDLVRVRQIALQADAGVFAASEKATEVEQKEGLKMRVQAARLALEKALAGLSLLKQSAVCSVMARHPDWDVYFQAQALKLDQEIERLCGVVQNSEL